MLRTVLPPGIEYARAHGTAGQGDALRPDIAGFAGIFERGPALIPVRIEDWGDFRARFGGFVTLWKDGPVQAYGPLALYGFYQNGGGSAIVFRVGSRDMQSAMATVRDPRTGAKIRLIASSPGAWGNAVSIQIPLRVLERRRVESFRLSGDYHPGALIRITDSSDERRVAWGVRTPDRASFTPATDETLQMPCTIEFIDQQVDVVVKSADRQHRLRGLTLDPDGVDHVWEALARTPRGPEWEPHIPDAWQRPLPAELELALKYQGPSRSGAVQSIDEKEPLLEQVTATSVVECPRGAFLKIQLSDGQDKYASIDPAVLHKAIEVLAAHPLPSLLAFPDLMLPVAPVKECVIHPGRRLALPRAVAPRPALPASEGRESAHGAADLQKKSETTVPDFAGEIDSLQAALIAAISAPPEGHGDRVALLDPRPGSRPVDVIDHARAVVELAGDAGDSRPQPASLGAMFYPWIFVNDPTLPSILRLVPPSGHVAGILARTSRQTSGRGAAARFANEAIEGAVSVERLLSDEDRANLNELQISAIHAMTPRGPVVFGARTLLEKSLGEPESALRFLPAARVLGFVRRVLRALGETLVFEPNDPALWVKVRVSIDLTLRDLYRAGAFAGKSPNEAYTVQCDAHTTTPADLAAGRVVALVGIAPTVPLEFIRIRVAFSRDGSSVSDDLPPPKART
jgi:hypothetical protein